MSKAGIAITSLAPAIALILGSSLAHGAQPGFPVEEHTLVMTLREDCTATLSVDGGPPTVLDMSNGGCFLDPMSSPPSVPTFMLPIAVVPGDVLVSEGGDAVSDLVRFPEVVGGNRVQFFSDPTGSEASDVGIPDYLRNTVKVTEPKTGFLTYVPDGMGMPGSASYEVRSDPSELACTTPDDCDDHVPCTDDGCGSVNGVFICSHTPNDTKCDDGNACTDDSCSFVSNDSCDEKGGAFTCTHTRNTDCHFECYEMRPEAFSGPSVTLKDQFGSVSGVFVQRPERLCAPANKKYQNFQGNDLIPSSPDHLTGYRIRYPFAKAPRLKVHNQFGDAFVDVVRPDRLLVPSAKRLEPPPPAAPNPPGIDHYECYQVRRNKNARRFQPISGVTVIDQFGTITVTLKRPTRVCTPVDKNGESPGAERHVGHLLCYRTSVTPFGQQQVFLNDQFGPITKKLITRQEFCVPSTKAPTCGNGRVDALEDCDPPDTQMRCTAPPTMEGRPCNVDAECNVTGNDGACTRHCKPEEVCNASCQCEKLDTFCKDPDTPLQHQDMIRPLQGGTEAMNRVASGRGTLGSFPRRDSDNGFVLLSNNHVFARATGNITPPVALIGERIDQNGGPYQCTAAGTPFACCTGAGTGPTCASKAGALADYELRCSAGTPGKPGSPGGDCNGMGAFNRLNRIIRIGPNFIDSENCIDAAIANICPGDAMAAVVNDGGYIRDVGVPAPLVPVGRLQPGNCTTRLDLSPGLVVRKSGTTTGLTCGTIVATSLITTVNSPVCTAPLASAGKDCLTDTDCDNPHPGNGVCGVTKVCTAPLASVGKPCGIPTDCDTNGNGACNLRPGRFLGQIEVTALDPYGYSVSPPGMPGQKATGNFSCSGDSGALVVGVATNRPIGLLFADNSGRIFVPCGRNQTSSSVANPIDLVLRRFNLHF